MLNRILCRGISFWKDVPQGPPDPILGIAEAFKRDPSSSKINLSVGAYRDDAGKPWVLPSVQEAKNILIKSNLDHEYAPIEGIESFRTAAAKLAYGDHAGPHVACLQSLSGTGSVRLGMAFLQRFYPQSRKVLIPKPTWGNHKNIVKDAGLEWSEYAYFDPSTNGLNYQGMMADLERAEKGTIILLHSCAHNPTGVDLKNHEWDAVLELFKKKEFLAFFDSAYQGFASGDIVKDSYGLRKFAGSSVPVMLAQSFAKNFGLYGERVGQFSLICESPDEATRVTSQLKMLARAIYSNPPIYGARIVSTVLNTPDLYQQWLQDIKTMADRIILMRSELVKNLKDNGSKRDWKHITDQIGMFAFTGLDKNQSQELMDKHHIYLTLDGRISLAGLNSSNVSTVAKAIYSVAG